MLQAYAAECILLLLFVFVFSSFFFSDATTTWWIKIYITFLRALDLYKFSRAFWLLLTVLWSHEGENDVYLWCATCSELCPVGSYEDDNECIPCPLGFYQDMDGAVECRPCPDERNTTFPAARNVSECKRLYLLSFSSLPTRIGHQELFVLALEGRAFT